MLSSRAPMKIWDFCLTYVTDTDSFTAHPIYNLDDMNPYEILNREKHKILEFIEYDWYATVCYQDTVTFWDMTSK